MAAPKMTRVQAVLAAAGLEAPAPFDDEWMFTACPRCGVAQSLGECPIRPRGPDTHYRCKQGCQDLLIVSPGVAGAELWPGRGYRFGEHLVRNVTEVVIVLGGVILIRLTASAAALLPARGQPATSVARIHPRRRRRG